MTTITFKLRDDTPAGEMGTALKEICSLSSVFNVKAVFPEQADKGQMLLYTADVTAGANADDAVKAISKAPYVELAYVAPARRAFR